MMFAPILEGCPRVLIACSPRLSDRGGPKTIVLEVVRPVVDGHWFADRDRALGGWMGFDLCSIFCRLQVWAR